MEKVVDKTIVILDEIRDLIPPLSAEEKKLLEESILREGCRDPLVLWEREDDFALIDGHHRKEICDRNKLIYSTKSLKFANVEQVHQWIFLNQLGRRNLTDSQKAKYIGELYESRKKEHGAEKGGRGNQYTKKQEKTKEQTESLIEEDKVVSGQNVHLAKCDTQQGSTTDKKTAETIAEETGVNEKTIRRNAEYSKALLKIKEVMGKKIQERILSEEIKLPQTSVIEISQKKPEDIREIFGELLKMVKAGKKVDYKKAKAIIKARREAEELERIRKEQEERERLEQKKKEIPVFCGDFYNLKIEPGSIDLILTDPPYPEEFLPEWEKLAKKAEEVLKPSGFLVCYSGHIHLPRVISSLSKHLNYYWILSLLHSGGDQHVLPRNVRCGWKPILIFQKPPFQKLDSVLNDVIKGTGREKELHPWQQAEGEVIPLIQKFSKENEIVFDPFAGSGSFLVSALKLNRQIIGCDINPDNIIKIKERLWNTEREMR